MFIAIRKKEILNDAVGKVFVQSLTDAETGVDFSVEFAVAIVVPEIVEKHEGIAEVGFATMFESENGARFIIFIGLRKIKQLRIVIRNPIVGATKKADVEILPEVLGRSRRSKQQGREQDEKNSLFNHTITPLEKFYDP